MERRKHPRLSATAFLNRPITLVPIKPFVGRAIKGKLIDLSAGGMAMLISQIIPQGTKLQLTVTFPDRSILKTDIEIVHVMPRDRHYVHGVQFLSLDPMWIDRLTKMSADFIDCEQRIQRNDLNPCTGTSCAFFTMCNKPQRTDLLVGIDDGLLVEFHAVQSSLR